MSEWIDFYDANPSIYVSQRHRDVHFASLAQDIAALIPFQQAVVLDYACGEALAAPQIVRACGGLVLAEPAPNVRARLTQRFATEPKIEVSSLEALDGRAVGTVDLAVLNSAAQYMTAAQFHGALRMIRRLLRPSGRLVLGDIIPPDAGPLGDAVALLAFGARHGFFFDAMSGLVRTALSDYRQLRGRLGLQRFSEVEAIAALESAGFDAKRLPRNLGHNQNRMAFSATPARG